MNRMMCRMENEILQLTMGIVKAAGRHIGAAVFDGFMVYKSTPDESPDALRSLLDACEVAIENRFEIPMKLLVKPMAEVIDLSQYRELEAETEDPEDDRARHEAAEAEDEERDPDTERARHEAAEIDDY